MKRCGCSSMPKCCKKKCVGMYTDTYKMYETCCYEMVKVCPCCGQEYDYRRYPVCPRCGAGMDDPPRGFGGFGRGGFGRGFGRFGRFGFPFRRRFFPSFFPFGFDGFSPDFEEEEEDFF
jgi:hypothetical protein